MQDESSNNSKLPNYSIRLFIEPKHRNDSVVPVRWEISAKLLENLKRVGAREPKILLDIVKVRKTEDKIRGREVLRKLAPLEQMMDYIQFSGPGEHVIFATLIYRRIDESSKSYYQLARKILRKEYGDYQGEFIGNHYDSKTFEFHRQYVCKQTSGFGQLNLTVDGGFFAKEPPPWLAKLANMWHEDKPKDQCKFRARCIWILPKLILLMLWLIIRSIFCTSASLICLSVLRRGVRVSPIFHPFNEDIQDIWEYMGKSYILYDKHGKERGPGYYLLLSFQPIVFPILFLLLSFLHLMVKTNESISLQEVIEALKFGVKWALILPFLFTAAIVLIILVIAVVVFIVSKIQKNCLKFQRENLSEDELENRRRLKLAKKLETELDGLIFKGTAAQASIDALPENKQTIYLRFNWLKAKVCKPFARY